MVYFLCNGQFHQLQSNKSSKPNKTVPQLDFCLMWYHFTCIVCAFLPWRALSLFLKECRLFLKGLMLGGFVMTHEDAGHFAAKHPADSALDEKISEAVRTNATNGKLSCSNASRIAKELQDASNNGKHPTELRLGPRLSNRWTAGNGLR